MCIVAPPLLTLIATTPPSSALHLRQRAKVPTPTDERTVYLLEMTVPGGEE